MYILMQTLYNENTAEKAAQTYLENIKHSPVSKGRRWDFGDSFSPTHRIFIFNEHRYKSLSVGNNWRSVNFNLKLYFFYYAMKNPEFDYNKKKITYLKIKKLKPMFFAIPKFQTMISNSIWSGVNMIVQWNSLLCRTYLLNHFKPVPFFVPPSH